MVTKISMRTERIFFFIIVFLVNFHKNYIFQDYLFKLVISNNIAISLEIFIY